MRSLLLSTAILPLAAAAGAEPLKIVADTLPVQSLVAQVTGDLADPALIVQPGGNPHSYNFRPSEAQSLQDADVVFWIGERMEPWLEEPVETLAADAVVIEFLAADGWDTLEFRTDPAFEHAHADADEDHDHEDDDHDHGEEAHDHDDDDHDHDQGEEGHERDEDHDHDEEGHDEHEDHNHAGVDPHAWTSPDVASAWVTIIADTLAEADPENAATYQANAAATKERLAALTEELNAELDPVRGKAFLVPHDALQYFETTFDFPAAGAVALYDASTPSPTRVRAVQDRIAEGDIACVLIDPQVTPAWVDLVREGTDAKTAEVDAMGNHFAPGPDHYEETIRSIAAGLVSCLSD